MSYPSTHKQLFDKQLIDENQFQKIEAIETGKLISVFYELRTLLYLGVLLLSTGVGILIYDNIGSIGHIVSVILIAALCVICFVYAFKKQQGYSRIKLNSPTPYFDYVLLLGCLLFISVFGYLQFLFNILDYLEAMTLVTAIFFFFIAYRFDHLGVLSLAITALASFWGLSITPQKWYESDIFSSANLYNTAIVFSVVLSCTALFLEKKNIKRHFTFSYINYCSLIFFVGTDTGLFDNNNAWGLYVLLQLLGATAIIYYARIAKSFLFLIYGFIFGYIAITYLLVMILPSGAEILWGYYLLFSCGGFIFFIIKYRNYFKREE